MANKYSAAQSQCTKVDQQLADDKPSATGRPLCKWIEGQESGKGLVLSAWFRNSFPAQIAQMTLLQSHPFDMYSSWNHDPQSRLSRPEPPEPKYAARAAQGKNAF